MHKGEGNVIHKGRIRPSKYCMEEEKEKENTVE